MTNFSQPHRITLPLVSPTRPFTPTRPHTHARTEDGTQAFLRVSVTLVATQMWTCTYTGIHRHAQAYTDTHGNTQIDTRKGTVDRGIFAGAVLHQLARSSVGRGRRRRRFVSDCPHVICHADCEYVKIRYICSVYMSRCDAYRPHAM